MNGNKTKRWMELCSQAAIEQDATKLLVLTNEINRLVEERGTPQKQSSSDRR